MALCDGLMAGIIKGASVPDRSRRRVPNPDVVRCRQPTGRVVGGQGYPHADPIGTGEGHHIAQQTLMGFSLANWLTRPQSYPPEHPWACPSPAANCLRSPDSALRTDSTV